MDVEVLGKDAAPRGRDFVEARQVPDDGCVVDEACVEPEAEDLQERPVGVPPPQNLLTANTKVMDSSGFRMPHGACEIAPRS